MKYKFCSIFINVTKYDVTFSTKFYLPPLPCGCVTAINNISNEKLSTIETLYSKNVSCFII